MKQIKSLDRALRLKSERLLIKLMFLGCLFLCGCGYKEKSNSEILNKNSYTAEIVKLELPEVKESYKIIVVNDLHAAISNFEVLEDNEATINSRIETDFCFAGLTAYERLLKLPDILNSLDTDLIVFAGDIIDFNSEANCQALKEFFDKINKPFIYLRSDHDLMPYWLEIQDEGAAIERQKKICEYEDVFAYDLGKVVVVGINKSYMDITEDGIITLRDAVSLNKPIVVATHVPIALEDFDALYELSMDKRGGRLLYWGNDAAYAPNEYTAEFIDMIYEDESPILAVLAAHIHYPLEAPISQNAIEHIFTPAYQGSIGIVEIN